jgi:hypothetical protein
MEFVVLIPSEIFEKGIFDRGVFFRTLFAER